MKKIKFLPSVLMLVLSVAVLALGVYAANPSTNTVTGSIKVNASSYPIAIRCLLDGEEIENHQTIRAGITWTDGLSNLEFNTDTALTVEDVKPRVLTMKITNLSNVDLGAYFLSDENTLTTENKATFDSISTVEHLVSGTDTIVKVTKTGYQKLEPNQTVEMTVTMSLYQIFYEEKNVSFTHILNIEECQDNLASMAQGITVNTNGVSMDKLTITPTVMHGYTNENLNAEGQEKAEADKMVALANTGRYATTNLAIDDDNYLYGRYEGFGFTFDEEINSHKRYRTTNVKFAIYNGEDYGITADINAVLEEEKIQVTTLGNAYIGAKEIGEVSLQLTPLRETTEVVTATINDIVSTINIYKATAETTAQADVYSRIKYNAQGYNGGTMKHYIEYGVNPFNPSQKLKWYVWGVKVGESALRAITADDMDANNKLIKSTSESTREYYFISEHVLNVSKDKDNGKYLRFSNEYDSFSWRPIGMPEEEPDQHYRFDSSAYESSLLRGYLSGATMRTEGYDPGVSGGDAANFYDFYRLTNDPIYNKINSRLLTDLETVWNSSTPAADYPYYGIADKFWALPTEEFSHVLGEGTRNSQSSLLSTGDAACWWITGMEDDDDVYYVRVEGAYYYERVSSKLGVRPAFKLEI